MERIWAPWRSIYVQSTGHKNKCFLCLDENDKEALIVGRTANAIIIMNRFPYNNGHVMVAPKRHTALIEELNDEEILDIAGLVKRMTVVFKEIFRVDGINIGMNIGKAAGAGLEDHLHIHMVPRWIGDTNFMPVVAETKVISEDILETYRKLKEGFEKLL